MPVTADFAGPAQTDTANRFRMLQSMARSHNTAGLSVPSGSQVPIPMDANDINTDGMWSGGANTKFTAQISGKYLVFGGLQWGAQASAFSVDLTIRQNGTTVLGQAALVSSAAQPTVETVCDLVSMSAGDYVEFCAQQNSGGNISILAGAQTFGAMLYVGE